MGGWMNMSTLHHLDNPWKHVELQLIFHCLILKSWCLLMAFRDCCIICHHLKQQLWYPTVPSYAWQVQIKNSLGHKGPFLGFLKCRKPNSFQLFFNHTWCCRINAYWHHVNKHDECLSHCWPKLLNSFLSPCRPPPSWVRLCYWHCSMYHGDL